MEILKDYFEQNGVAINLDDYLKVEEGQIGVKRHWCDPFIDSIASKLYDQNTIAFNWVAHTPEYSWITSGVDCYGKSLNYNPGDVLIPRNMQYVVADIIRHAVDANTGMIYLYFPQKRWYWDGMHHEISTIASNVARVLYNITGRRAAIIDLYDGMLGAMDDRGILINLYKSDYINLVDNIPQIIKNIDIPEASYEQYKELIASQFISAVLTYGAYLPDNAYALSADDVDLDLEIAFGIESTPWTPEKFANRLLTDYGYFFDTSRVIHGTRLAKIHKIIKTLPRVNGILQDHMRLIERVIQYCIDHANMKKTKTVVFKQVENPFDNH